MTTSVDNTTRPVNFIRFHGLTLLVVEIGGLEYVQVKPINDLVGLSWRRTRDTVQMGANEILYGTRRLMPPVFDSLRDLKVSQTPVDEGAGGDGGTENTSQMGEIYILLERVEAFLMRVNTDRVKANGNELAAKWLLALQIEWAQALHAYETNGIAIKKGQKDATNDLSTLYKLRLLAETPAERKALANLIGAKFVELGESLTANPQQDLALIPTCE